MSQLFKSKRVLGCTGASSGEAVNYQNFHSYAEQQAET